MEFLDSVLYRNFQAFARDPERLSLKVMGNHGRKQYQPFKSEIIDAVRCWFAESEA